MKLLLKKQKKKLKPLKSPKNSFNTYTMKWWPGHHFFVVNLFKSLLNYALVH